ncbi:T9SS type A sorting domain-containing protein [Flavobacterium sp. SH_e]|uniref:T9SS type A sorting domain-containing protein n=1 Tax=Flavobacterium sp. SH_e TaxID=2983767 RepID=UPI0021E3BB7D|nr:T9SS type A sorting domain-containing protein [Flavobacterium sp. SH_e]MCV2484333.1 T9SS type A sorting domain-containing protein [Flavobacterium sp. SH_e]
MMKKLLFFILLPLLGMGQVQIGDDIYGEPTARHSGSSISLSSNGRTLAIGSPGTDNRGNETGSVNVYKYDSGSWGRIGYEIHGVAAGDYSGSSVALSGNGYTLAVGSPGNDLGGADAGLVRLYYYVSGWWQQIGSDFYGESVGDNSGSSISLSSNGNIIAIGSPGNDANGTDAGSVRVYESVAGVWTQVGADIDGEAAGDASGSSVSLSSDGSIVTIGSPGNDGNGTDSGSVRVYKNVAGIWTKIGADIDGEAGGDNSGASVSLSSDGNTLAIGASGNDGNGADAGSVRVYQNASGTWTKIGGDIDGESAGDSSGKSISLSSDGSMLIIGSPLNSGNGADAGSVRVYQNVSGTWTKMGADMDGVAAGDNLGASVFLSGDGATLAAGAPFNDGNGPDAGAVSLYQNVSGTWTKMGNDIKGDPSEGMVGVSASISDDGTILAIGDWINEANAGGYHTGSARVYKNLSGIWTQIGDDIDGEKIGDYLGYSLSLSGNGAILAVGAYANDASGDQAGSVRVYENKSGAWTQIGDDIDGEAAGDNFGICVSLSGDGTVVAIAAPYNDAKGDATGSVRVYKNVSGTWTKIGGDIDGEAAGDYSGNSISLSSDGNTLAIGAYLNSGSGTYAGSVRVYQNVSGVWTQIGADIDGKSARDRSGTSVSLSGDGTILAIGAPGNLGDGSYNGYVRVYKNVSGTWTQLGADIIGEAFSDESGFSVSLSSDGSILAIGAHYNDGKGDRSGSVRVYKNVSGAWIKIGSDIDGEAPGDESGHIVSLSGDGSALAIGAPYNGTNGHVRVYGLSPVLSSDSFVLGSFSVYPNPASEAVTISLEDGLALEEINVYNALGQLVKTEKKAVITVNSLAKGIYFFQVITSQGKATKKVIIN